MPTDEPSPVNLLPGHNSSGRFEQVLWAGRFAVTTEMGASRCIGCAGSLSPCQRFRWLGRCHQRDGRFGRQLPYVECRSLCFADPQGLRDRDANILPRS